MTNRNLTLTLFALAALGAGLGIYLRAPKPSPEQPAAPTSISSATTSTPEVVVARHQPSRTPMSDTPHAQVGKASGGVHFTQLGTSNGAPAARIDIKVRSALGVWLPAESRMRIYLLESAPGSAEVEQLLVAAQADEPAAASSRGAVIDLRFSQTAQAFDRNDLESATLTAHDGALASVADALNGLDWSGSLPSPQVELPSGSDHPVVELTSRGDNVSADRITWQQAWQLSLNVPVVMLAPAAPET